MDVRIVLVGTTHPGNIGASARAMKNMGLHDLVLVRPRFFPHDDATARASGAEDILEKTRVCATLDEALADCSYVAGASARSRSVGWPGMAPRECAARLLAERHHGKAAAVFGPENSGLTNDDLDRCHTLLTIPTVPGFSSLNLAMAVQVLSYELRVTDLGGAENPAEADIVDPEPTDAVPPASGEDLERFYTHLETALVQSGYLDPDNPRLLMRRLRRLYSRALLDRNEVNILRGILASMERRPKEDAS